MSEEKSCGDNVIKVEKKLSASQLCEQIVELHRKLGVTAKKSVQGTDPKTWMIVELTVLDGLVIPTKLATHKLRDLLAAVEAEVSRLSNGNTGTSPVNPGLRVK